jgi:hypothetical protein
MEIVTVISRSTKSQNALVLYEIYQPNLTHVVEADHTDIIHWRLRQDRGLDPGLPDRGSI